MDVAALTSGLVTGLREGVEAALIIAIICAYLAKTGNRSQFLLVFLGAGTAIGGFAAVGAIGNDHHDRFASEYVHSLEALGGKSLRAAPMVGAGGFRAGEAFAYQGQHSWVYVSVDYWVPGGTYQIVVDGPGGQHRLGEMQVVGGHGSWGGAAPSTVGKATAIRLVDTNGAMQCEARLSA